MDPLDRLVSQEWHHPLVQELHQLLSAHYPHNQHAYMIGRAGGLAWQHVDATGPAALTWFSMLSQAPKQRGVRRLLEAVPKDDEAVRRQLEQLVQRMEKAAEAAPPRGRVDVGTAHRRTVAWEAAPEAADAAAPGAERSAISDERTGLTLVRVPGGSARLGERDHPFSLPETDVQLETFWMSVHPVTRGQYRRFLQAVGGAAPRAWAGARGDQARLPATHLSWPDALAYCSWAGAALPTESQWEHACRAGTRTRYWCGGDERDLARCAWYAKNSGAGVHPVASLAINPFGLCDMHGNVWELCAHDAASAVAHHEAGQHPSRGGGFASEALYAASASRQLVSEMARRDDLGFRVCKAEP